MKRFAAVVLCICMILSLAACGSGGSGNGSGNNGGKNQGSQPSQGQSQGGSDASEYDYFPSAGEITEERDLVLGMKNTSEGFAQFTLAKVDVTDVISASRIGRTIENNTPGEVFVDAVLDWTNLLDYSVYTSEAVIMTATDSNGNTYEGSTGIEEEDMNGIPRANAVAWGEILPETPARLHCYVSVPETTDALDLRLCVGSCAYSLSCRLDEELTTATEIAVGDTIEDAGLARLTFNGISYSRELEPSDKSGSYYSIVVQGPDSDANTFLIAAFTLTNLSDSVQSTTRFMNAAAQFTDFRTYVNDMYGDGAVCETVNDIPGFDYEIGAGETKNFFLLIQVPEEKTPDALKLSMTFGGKDYIYRLGDHALVRLPDPIIPLGPDTLRKGAIVGFGKYEQDNDFTNGSEDIEWIVLDKVDGYWLLISKYALETKTFHSEYADQMWENCDLRYWLNTTFVEKAFSSEDLEKIEERTVPVLVGNNSKLSYGSDTTDLVFLLSSAEAEKYFPTDEDRLCGITDYVEAIGALSNPGSGTYNDGKPVCNWWLRNHTDNPCGTYVVSDTGMVVGYTVNSGYLAVRPAIWIKCD